MGIRRISLVVGISFIWVFGIVMFSMHNQVSLITKPTLSRPTQQQLEHSSLKNSDGSSSSVNVQKIVGFFHTGVTKDANWILPEMLHDLNDSQVFDHIEKIHVGVIGKDNHFTIPEYLKNKMDIVVRNPELKQFEFPTLQKLYEFCRSNNDYWVFYMHSKGGGWQSEAKSTGRRWLEYWTVTRHHDCMTALETHDMCSVFFRLSPWRHYSGNHWWARCDYVSRIIKAPFDMNRENRFQAEEWVGTEATGPPMKALDCAWKRAVIQNVQRYHYTCDPEHRRSYYGQFSAPTLEEARRKYINNATNPESHR